jgi:hypothetical protein
MERYSNLCITYEKHLLENCRELKTDKVDCESLEQIYKGCLDFKERKAKTNTKITVNEIFVLLMSSR